MKLKEFKKYKNRKNGSEIRFNVIVFASLYFSLLCILILTFFLIDIFFFFHAGCGIIALLSLIHILP
jgi:hypothetical protein